MSQKLFAIMLLFLVAAPNVFGHDLRISWKREKNVVHVHAFFDGNTPAVRAKFKVLDANGEELASGRGDEEGHWRFEDADRMARRIEATAIDNHRARVDLQQPSPPTMDEAHFPWIKAVLGIGVIGVFTFAAIVAVMVKRRRTQTEHKNGARHIS